MKSCIDNEFCKKITEILKINTNNNTKVLKNFLTKKDYKSFGNIGKFKNKKHDKEEFYGILEKKNDTLAIVLFKYAEYNFSKNYRDRLPDNEKNLRYEEDFKGLFKNEFGLVDLMNATISFCKISNHYADQCSAKNSNIETTKIYNELIDYFIKFIDKNFLSIFPDESNKFYKDIIIKILKDEKEDPVKFYSEKQKILEAFSLSCSKPDQKKYLNSTLDLTLKEINRSSNYTKIYGKLIRENSLTNGTEKLIEIQNDYYKNCGVETNISEIIELADGIYKSYEKSSKNKENLEQDDDNVYIGACLVCLALQLENYDISNVKNKERFFFLINEAKNILKGEIDKINQYLDDEKFIKESKCLILKIKPRRMISIEENLKKRPEEEIKKEIDKVNNFIKVIEKKHESRITNFFKKNNGKGIIEDMQGLISYKDKLEKFIESKKGTIDKYKMYIYSCKQYIRKIETTFTNLAEELKKKDKKFEELCENRQSDHDETLFDGLDCEEVVRLSKLVILKNYLKEIEKNNKTLHSR